MAIHRLRLLPVFAVSAAFFVAGCTTTKQFSASAFQPPQGAYKLVVMRPDVSVGLLTAGGDIEQREDWSSAARTHILKSLASQQSIKGGTTTIAETRQSTGAPPQLADELDRLHKTVGTSIKVHKYGPLELPTKKDKFDWTLGETAVSFGKASGYDYALFLHIEDSFSSGGRMALQAVELLGCTVGVCIMSNGGQQIAFASLVDLKNGDVVWFNTLSSSVGDVRTPEGAEKLVANLLSKMEAPKK